MTNHKMNILLVEPGYKNKYPPLGLMKLASYHRLRGDHVVFVKGNSPHLREKKWDRIYITTLFSFYWKETIQTIRYYGHSTSMPENIYVGGIMASLMADSLHKELNSTLPITIVEGLLDKPKQLDKDSSEIIEHMVPNYAILDDIDYKYGVDDAYLGYATRGCVNNCSFCAVRKLEPYPQYKCQYHTSILGLIHSIDNVYGPKRDLLLLDNNILASPDYETIINEILDAGFEAGATLAGKQRRLDFNQGLDARLLTPMKMKLLAKTAIKPIRFAFDQLRMQKSYEHAVRLSYSYGVNHYSTYVLFNYNDTPGDFYNRLRTNIELNEELGAQISSFPMKYIPITAKNRRHIGKYWHRKLIRGVQCILLATKGMVSPKREFFEAAFGHNETEFREICMMPEQYIIYRRKSDDRADDWRKLYHRMGLLQHNRLLELLAQGKIRKEQCMKESGSLRKIIGHYIESNGTEE
jgi:hypothetical protein